MFLSLLLPACRTPDTGPEPRLPDTSAPPDWSSRPLSWDKLAEIQDWLQGSGSHDWPKLKVEAELELAEGRVTLVRREANGLPRAVLDQRIRKAQAGFRRVLADPEASVADLRRAEAGLRDARPLFVPPASTPKEPSLAIRDRGSWGAKPAVPGRLTPTRRPWDRITVHHSALPSPGTVRAAVSDAIRRIQLAHMRDEGYGDIGYHFLIDSAGRIYQGRDLDWQGAHAGGVNNVGNIGICLLGDFERERPDPRALDSLQDLIAGLRDRHGIPATAVKGHRSYRPTACPGRNLQVWVEGYAASDRLGSIRYAKSSAPVASPIR